MTDSKPVNESQIPYANLTVAEATPDTVVTRSTFSSLILKEIVAYCNEAEHQDGREYWCEFDNDHHAIQDFITYYLAKTGEI